MLLLLVSVHFLLSSYFISNPQPVATKFKPWCILPRELKFCLLYYIELLMGLNPLSHGAFCQEHVFWTFWNFVPGCMLAKLAPIN